MRDRKISGRRAAGFTLIEIVIAASLLSVALLAIAGMFPMGYRDIHTSGDLTKAVALAQQKMEQLKNLGYSSVSGGSDNPAGGFARTWTVTTPFTGVKMLTVTVTLPVTNKQVQLQTYLAQ